MLEKISTTPYTSNIVTHPLPGSPSGIEVAQVHAAMAEDLLAHAQVIGEEVGEKAALKVFEKATDEYFKAHQAAGNDIEELGSGFFEGRAEAEAAIALAETVPTDTREIAALHSISNIDQALSVGGLSRIKAHKLRSRQNHLRDVARGLDQEAPISVGSGPRPALRPVLPVRLRDARDGHIQSLKAHTETIMHVGKQMGARVLERFMTHTQEISIDE